MSKKLWSALLSFLLMLSLVVPAAGAAPLEQQIELDNVRSAQDASRLKDILKKRAQLKEFPQLDQSLKRSSAGSVRVIVELSTEPVALAKGISFLQGQTFSSSAEAKVEAQVELEQQTFIRALAKNRIRHEVSEQYRYAFNGVSMEMDASQVEALLDIPGVLGVYRDYEVTVGPKDKANPYMKDTGPFIGAPEVWELGYTGKGIKVGVIDTGIDYMHPVLKDAYKGGYDLVDNDNDPYETTPIDWKNDPSNPEEVNDKGSTYWTDHGTHVAGIIGARDVGEYGVAGIAPEAEIYAYRVLGPYGNGYTSWVLGGIDRSVEDGMDVINLSLGTSRNDPDYVTSVALNHAALAGVTPVVASGNTGPERWTLGSPGAAAFPITVGNSTGPSEEITATAHFFTDGEWPEVSLGNQEDAAPMEGVTPITVIDATYRLDLMAWNLADDTQDVLHGEFELVYAGLAKPEDFIDKDVTGKIALIQRGDLPFVEKIANAKAAGAKGAIIFNQMPGPIDVLLGDSFAFIPTFSMSKEHGDYIQSLLDANPNLKVSFTDFMTNRNDGDEINDSSSRGPAKKTLDIKPDVVAPGTSILSSIPVYGRDIEGADYSQSYDRFTGTSMAAPHVAGLAALILEKHPDWTPFDVKVALMNNAKVLDTASYDVADQGAGRVQALHTIQAEALIKVLDRTSYHEKGQRQEHDEITGSISFGNFTGGTATTVQKKIKVEQIGNIGGPFEVQVRTTKSTPGAAVTVDQPSFDLNGEQELTVTLQVPAGISEVSEQQGYILFKNGNRTYSVPYVAYFNLEMSGVKYTKVFSDTEDYLPHFSLNEQGELGGLNVGFEFYNPIHFLIVDLYDSLHPESGPDQDGVIGQIFGADGFLFDENMEYSFKWTGEYWNYTTNDIEQVQDGLYSVELFAVDMNWNVYNDYSTSPFFVKTKAPEIKTELDVKGSSKNNPALKGTIDDLYVTAAPAMWDEWAIDFDVSEWLDASYVVNRPNKTVAKQGSLDVEQDGAFNIALDGLSPGKYTVELSVKDRQGLEGKATVNLQLTGTPGPGKPDPGNSSGGSGGGGSSTGGGSAGTPSTPAPEVSGDAKVTTKNNADGSESAAAALSETKVAAGITGKDEEVKLDVSKLDFSKYREVALSLGKAAVDKLKASGKPLVITGNGFALTVTADALDDFTSGSGFSLPVSVAENKAQTGNNLNVVSPTVTIQHKDKFKKPLLLTLNYDPAKVKDKRKVGAYIQSDKADKGDLQSAGLLESSKRGSVTFRVNGPGSYVAAENSVTFNDIVGHWAKDEIEVAASQHITNGTGVGRFSPNNVVTRAEFASLLDRIFDTGIDWETRSQEPGAKQPLTREEMVMMMAEAMDIDFADEGLLSFQDSSSISKDAHAAVSYFVSQGLVKGVNGNRFAPGETSTRAQVSIIVYRLLGTLNKI